MYMIAFLALVVAQPQAPPVKQPMEQAPPVRPTQAPYDAALTQSAREGKPFVVFVGTRKREVLGTVTVSSYEINDDATPRILYTKDRKRFYVLPIDATDAQIRRAAGLEVSQLANHFRVASPDNCST